MATYIAKENKCAYVNSGQPTTAKLAETNKYCVIGGEEGYSRSYLNFDLSGLSDDVEITKATLFFYGNGGGSSSMYVDSLNDYCEIHTITAIWDADSVTWNTQPNTVKHCNFSLSHSSQMTADITSVVQGWVNGTIDTNGICVRTVDNEVWTKNRHFRFYNHYSDAQDYVPYIEIEYKGNTMYKISENRLRQFGDEVRRLTSSTDQLTPEEMVTGLQSVVPYSDPVLQDKIFSENGVFVPDEGYDGFGEVVVTIADLPTVKGVKF